MRNPKTNPKPGERFAKVIANKRGVRTVQSRKVLSAHRDHISYTPRRVQRKANIRAWRKWVADAKLCT